MSDLIDRQAAIDAIVNTVSRVGLHDNSEVARYGATFRQHEIIDIIETLPSAQPERKKGKWAVRVIRGNWADDVISTCSECGTTFRNLDVANYCPNCGARMEEEEDG